MGHMRVNTAMKAYILLLATSVYGLKEIFDPTTNKTTTQCNRWGYWGANCADACSVGCKPVVDSAVNFEQVINTRACDRSGGDCLQKPLKKDDQSCDIGWRNSQEYHRCDIPLCFGDHGCDWDGVCIEPDYCICGDSGAQVVGIAGDYEYSLPNGEGDHTFNGIQCVSLRLNGLKGAFVALIIMMVSVSTCGFIAEKRNKDLSKRY